MLEVPAHIKIEVKLHLGVGALGDKATFYVKARDVQSALNKLVHMIKCKYTVVSVTT
ncbi:hypothetical protein SEA_PINEAPPLEPIZZA_23 [Microbacterium phage PineapplePizza]|uniref:Uncharacterized protein n=1 Tax=Microbacterium phage PineapplePizza TaxID=2927268 RepID=A0A976YDQ7_9CAUD|nr:hypothetical protein QEH41_gp23 [Microbacterium phage PineapplePizza]UVF60431.1 hypothetical protein SEA_PINEAPPLEPIZZA_23 [Microbacterium phage PineapplePizza]